MSDGMGIPHGIDRMDAEIALDTLLRASAYQVDEKMMAAVGEVARQRRETLDKYSPADVPRKLTYTGRNRVIF